MTQVRPFRLRDRVTIHGLIRSKGEPTRGRVICVDRKSRYDESVMVLYETANGDEMCETFRTDGTRYILGASCYITLGWPKDEDEG